MALYQNTVKGLTERFSDQIDTELQQFAPLKGLPFYHWNKPMTEQQGTFVGTVGLPEKRGVSHPLYDYEQRIFEYLQRDEPTDPKNRHLYILKSSGLGATTFLSYYAAWKCTTTSDWAGGRVCILTAPRIELTIDIIDRFKKIFTKWDSSIAFDSRNTVCNVNGVKVEAFPSHLGLKGMRGLTDIKMILYDEASFFDFSQINEARATAERYYSKSNPIIVLCSTPDRPNDLMDLIRQEPEESCFYHRMYLSYKVGVDKIYTREEIALQHLSPSFPREMDLQFAGQFGSIFHLEDIEAAVQNGRSIDYSKLNEYTKKSVGIDMSPGKAGFGICVSEVLNHMVNVVYAQEYPRLTFSEQIETAVEVIRNYRLSFQHGDRIYIDGSMPAFINDLSIALGGTSDVQKSIDYLKAANPGYVDTELLIYGNTFIIPIAFGPRHKPMLAKAKAFVESDGTGLAINPEAKKFITSLQTAEEKSEGSLDKDRTSYHNVFDAFRLSIIPWNRVAYRQPAQRRHPY